MIGFSLPHEQAMKFTTAIPAAISAAKGNTVAVRASHTPAFADAIAIYDPQEST